MAAFRGTTLTEEKRLFILRFAAARYIRSDAEEMLSLRMPMRYNERLVVKIAMLYYLKDLDQDDIAHRLGLSRQSVSRQLRRARELGIVQFKIDSPTEVTFAELEMELETAFGLKAAVIAPVNLNSDDMIKDAIGEYAAGFIEQNVRDGDLLGVSWSSTVFACAKNLKNNGAKNLTICQLNGSMDVADFSTRAESSFPRSRPSSRRRQAPSPRPCWSIRPKY